MNITNSKKVLLIQTSPTHTCSTFLINSLYGLFENISDKKILGTLIKSFEFEDISILKCHNINIDNLIEIYKDENDLYDLYMF